jgi:hypothetical protein
MCKLTRTVRIYFPPEAVKYFYHIQMGYGVYQWTLGMVSLGARKMECEIKDLPPISAEI